MKQADSSHNKSSDNSWQFLGELTLPADSKVDSAIGNWLTTIIAPFDLSPDFLNRVLESVQESVTRALQPNTAMAFGYIYLSIFAPSEHVSQGRTWGFFHIERIEYRGEAVDTHDHAIDFYLYMEGRD